MSFADAWRSEENDVAGFVNESQGTQVLNLALVDGRLKSEVKLIEVLDEWQMRQLQPGTQIPAAPRNSSAVRPGNPHSSVPSWKPAPTCLPAGLQSPSVPTR